VASMVENSNAHGDFVGKPELQRLFRGRGGRWMIILKWILKRSDWEAVDLIDVAQGKDVSDFCDHDNEISCSIKCR
jgi:hypothetical protein